MSTFEGKLTVEKILNAVADFKKLFYHVNYINKLINQNQEQIKTNGYNNVIRPFIDKKFINNNLNNTNTNENRCDFYIATIPIKKEDAGESMNYYSSRFPELENIPFKNRQQFMQKNNDIINSKTRFHITPGAEQNMLKTSLDSTITKSNYLNECLKINPDLTYIYQVDTRNDPDGVVIVLRIIRRDIINQEKWISMSSSLKVIPYFDYAKKMNQTSLLPVMSQIFNDLFIKLETSKWNNQELIKNIWEYSNISNIDNTKCLYSEKYPNWNGKYVSECFIPNSNIDIQKNMNLLFDDLYFNYPSLSLGELAVSTRNLNGINILSLCKIDTYNDSQCIKEVQINLNLFVKKINNIVGDTVLKGNLNILNFVGDSIIQTDNVTKNISVHGKIGINQDFHEIKGLLDIDNLSNENILTIVDKISDLNNTSYNVFNEVNDTILSSETFNISDDYTNEIVILKIPILNKIQESDISFLHKPSNILKNNKFSNDSFLKIQKIVNEINRMSYEIDNYYNKKGKNIVMSFVELLNDTEYYYVCSLKTIFKDSDIYFVMSYTLVQNIMIDNSHKTIFNNLINNFSSLNRLLNYSILVVELPDILDKLLQGDSVNSFTKYIQDGEFSDRFGAITNPYVFCYAYSGNNIDKNNVGNYLFAEDYPKWNSKFLENLILPNSDKNLLEISLTSMLDYHNRYGLYKNSQNFINHYLFDKGEKISFLNRITIKQTIEDSEVDVEYAIGAGMSLVDFIDPSILSVGDNKITGNLYIEDENNSKVFCVDTEYNKIVNMYKTGFGTDEPKTVVDVNDSGLTDIIHVIEYIATIQHNLNLNITFIKNLDIINAENVDNCININFIDSSSISDDTIKYIQTVDDYFYCELAAHNDNVNDFKNIYTWLYRNWDDTNFINIDDKNNKYIIETYIKDSLNNFKTQYVFENAQKIFYSDWTFGTKQRVHKIFKKNNELYLLGNGVNISKDLKFNNNGNISSFFDYIKHMNLYLQNLIIRYENIDTVSIPNYISVSDYLNIVKNIFPLNKFDIKKIVTDFTNFQNTKVYNVDFDTLAESGNDQNKNIYQITDVNFRNKYLLMLTNIKSIYGKQNNNTKLFNKGDYGIINFEDSYVDFVSLFYCLNVNSNDNLVTLISIELQINSVILPSVDIRGDLRIKGDTYFHNNTTDIDFMSVDTNDSFVGIGTNIRYANYSNNYITTTNNDISKHNFIVSGTKYPVSVHERTAEILPDRDNTTGVIVNYPNDKLPLFSNRTSVTARRNSDYYTASEMKEYAAKYKETALDGPNIGKQIGYRYGPDYNFEIKDSTTIVHELGNMHMVIDDISGNIIKPGFGISVADTNSTGGVVERELLYINNKGVMDIDKINLGTDVDKINTVSLSALNKELMIGNKSLQTLINEQIQQMFSVGTDGKLNITYNGIVYVCQPK